MAKPPLIVWSAWMVRRRARRPQVPPRWKVRLGDYLAGSEPDEPVLPKRPSFIRRLVHPNLADEEVQVL